MKAKLSCSSEHFLSAEGPANPLSSALVFLGRKLGEHFIVQTFYVADVELLARDQKQNSLDCSRNRCCGENTRNDDIGEYSFEEPPLPPEWVLPRPEAENDFCPVISHFDPSFSRGFLKWVIPSWLL